MNFPFRPVLGPCLELLPGRNPGRGDDAFEVLVERDKITLPGAFAFPGLVLGGESSDRQKQCEKDNDPGYAAGRMILGCPVVVHDE